MTAPAESSKRNRKPNRLARASSPYLRQHQYNPVDWWPWCDEAFETAVKQDKPIFLSIGYSTCHWCHVMEHESFEDQATADLLNKHFISIKLDREERPDLDSVYMTALQQVSGGGGWPMSVMLDHQRRPFFLGTYLPPEDRYGRPSFKRILSRAAEMWHTRRSDLLDAATTIAAGISESDRIAPGKAPGWEAVAKAYQQLAGRFDAAHGGFGTRPKFPTPHVYNFMLGLARRGDLSHAGLGAAAGTAAHMALFSLDRIALGGIRDHVGGGFHRYSTDAEWRLPHFEKMLYDQALLALAYLDAYELSRDVKYANVARDIFRYVLRDLRDPSSGFRSAEDADSDGGEGKFYTYTMAELRAILGDDAPIFVSMFQCADGGNWRDEATGHVDGTNILHLAVEHAERAFADREWVRAAFEKLRAHREQRPRPLLDDKVIASWNGLMLWALARGARVLGRDAEGTPLLPGDPTAHDLLDAAVACAHFIEQQARGPGGLWHSWRAGERGADGFLDDFAFVGRGMLELHQTTMVPRWLSLSVQLAEQMLALFAPTREDATDTKPGGGLYFTRATAHDVLVRRREIYDGAEPSGNSVAFDLLSSLGRLLGRADFLAAADGILREFAQQVSHYPSGHTRLLCGIMDAADGCEVTVVASDCGDTNELLTTVIQQRRPGTLLLSIRPETRDEIRSLAPSTEFMQPVSGLHAAYVCRAGSCSAPVSDPDALRALLSR